MPPTPSQFERVGERRFTIALIVLAVLVRLFRLGYQSLWVDEMLTLAVSTPEEGLNIWSYLQYNVHGPLHSAVVYLFQLVSRNDAWLRLPSAAAGVAGVVYMYRWTRWWLTPSLARLAALMLAVHPLHVYYSQELRNYAFLLFFALLSCHHFHRLLEGGRARNQVAYVLGMTCAALSNFTAAFLFLAHTIMFIARHRFDRRPLLRWLVMAVAILVLISPWVYRIHTYIDIKRLVTPVAPGELEDAERLRGATTFSWLSVPYTMYTYSVGFSLGPSTRELHQRHDLSSVFRGHWLEVCWVVVLFGVVGLMGLRTAVRNRLRWRELCLYLLVPIACTLVLNWQNAKPFNVRYVLLGFPAFVCLLAAGLGGLGKWVGKAAALAVLATLVVSTGNYYFNGRYARDDVKRATGYVERRIADGECIFAPTVANIVARYATRNDPILGVYQRAWTPKERVDAQMSRLFAGCNAFWYVRARPWVDDADGYVWDQISSRYRQVEVANFDGVTVIHFERK